MKRLMNIMMAFTLSMMLLFMGSGAVVVHCNHSGMTKVVAFEDACNKKCKTTSKCMKVTVLKFSDMSQVISEDLVKLNLPVVALPWLAEPLFEFTNFEFYTQDALLRSGCRICGPPREYLNLLCVLLI